MEITNYKVTVTQPDDSEYVTLYNVPEFAEEFAASLTGWPCKVEQQRFNVEIGTVVTFRSIGDRREITGAVDKMREMAHGKVQFHVLTGNSRDEWFYGWQVLSVHEASEMREHKWLPPIEPLSGIRTCSRLGCYAQWMPGKAEKLGCKGTDSE